MSSGVERRVEFGHARFPSGNLAMCDIAVLQSDCVDYESGAVIQIDGLARDRDYSVVGYDIEESKEWGRNVGQLVIHLPDAPRTVSVTESGQVPPTAMSWWSVPMQRWSPFVGSVTRRTG